ncbi:uncharacterized protein LOC655292 [Tribolium castaneum]|uniref:uncharacterized protein LOC655292 n=1 Tax=Tribolium castaneum TaxID=7070 RepID=UPI0030FE4565
MCASSNFEKQLLSVLDDAAKKLNLTNYSVNLNLTANKGDGFLGEFYKVSITDNETNLTHHLVIKRAPTEAVRRTQDEIEEIYRNEIFFYTEVYPAFKQFEKEQHMCEAFDSIPEFVTCCKEPGRELLVFKDITKAGFELREKNLLLDDQHTRYIFKTYGHFHAISFCMKEQDCEKFETLTKSLKNIWLLFAKRKAFRETLAKISEKVCESLDPIKDSKIVEKYQNYKNNCTEIFEKSGHYEGKYSGIIHGDCWSNNMMFKYQEPAKSKLVDMNLLDFQLFTTGTPVYDLSYFFYTGGSKKLFDKLEDYLDIYHASFCKTAINLGCDPRKLLPRKVLSEEWRKYAKYGMILAFVLTKIKLTSKEDHIAMVENADKQKSVDEDVDAGETFMQVKYDEELFKERVRDILLHMYEIDAL